MITVDELPFKFVEGMGFKYFMSLCCPRFNIPSRRTMTRDCFGFYGEMKDKLKKFFQSCEGSVCLTTDAWTSNKQDSFMCLTAHFIDQDWKLRKKIINFGELKGHKGVDIAEGIVDCLDGWGIKKVFSITVDNASSNDTAVAKLKEVFNARGISICDNAFLHMRCVAHILNLVVSDGLGDISLSVKRFREAVRFIRNSPERLKRFHEFAAVQKIEGKRGLCLDVPTRWNSTFLMLQAAERFEKVFMMYEMYDEQFRKDLESKKDRHGIIGVPEKTDWDNARRMMGFLGRFYDFTLKISGSHYTTSNLFLQEVHSLYHLINKWVEEVEKDYDLSVMAKKMKLKYEKYWGDVDKMNKLLYIATVMDPRYKLGFLEYGLKRVYPEDGKGGRMAEDVRKATFELFAHYEQVWRSKQHKGASTATLTPIVEECGNDVIDVLAEYKRHREQIDGAVNKSELERYLREADEPMEMNFDVLGWWKVNCSRFPALSMMAKDVLAAPISTVASESAFSAGGRILDDFRSSLTPRIVEALICSSDWIRGDSRPSLDEEDAEEVDKIDEGKILKLALHIYIVIDF
ncbi:unnamed protein product [Linum tenue]|uniref:Transposase n=1 Tax=Linum tenue TaxID=586396 RepID=A0AAV0RUS2_9ROSI|nr:unnamed protein product [Linum tenue]